MNIRFCKNSLMSLLLLLLMSILNLNAQQYFYTNTGTIFFKAISPIETIRAENNQVEAKLNRSDGKLIFRVFIKSFIFKKRLMQEHFNGSFMHSNTYPISMFEGEILDFKKIDLSKNATHIIRVKGTLSMHGEKVEKLALGRLEIKDGVVQMQSVFNIHLNEFKIYVPEKLDKRVAKDVRVTVNCALSKH